MEGPDAGLILAVGWPGQWAATFARDGADGLHLRAGQERVRLTLHPGEEIRTPLIALQMYRGDRLRAQNVWRRWMLAHNLPRLENGEVPGPLMPAASSNQCNEMQNANETNQKQFVDGYLAYWDALRQRRPGLLIDTCASGGRRNDLETLRRSVPLHKSDMQYGNLTSKQTQLHGLALWVPYFGAPVYPADRVDVYGFRSGIAPMTGLGYDTRRTDYDYALLRKLVAEWKQVAPLQYGDYYPLTPWRADDDVWMAWQFDRPETGEGVIQAFRRPESSYESARYPLRGLDPEATYEVRDVDAAGPVTIGGRELTEQGLRVTIPGRPGAAIVFYTRVKESR